MSSPDPSTHDSLLPEDLPGSGREAKGLIRAHREKLTRAHRLEGGDYVNGLEISLITLITPFRVNFGDDTGFGVGTWGLGTRGFSDIGTQSKSWPETWGLGGHGANDCMETTT